MTELMFLKELMINMMINIMMIRQKSVIFITIGISKIIILSF